MAVIQLPILKLRRYQTPLWKAMVEENYRRAITVWPRRNGKDLVAINIIAAKACQKVGTYFYMGPYYNQIRQIIWEGMDGTGKKFTDYIPEELIEKTHNQDMRITLKNGSVIKLCGSDNIDSIVGTNPIGIVFTEFSLHKPEAWHYLRPILAENGGWALFNGTPRGLNHFYQLLKAAEKDPENWFTQYLTRDDTGIPTMEAIDDDRRSGMPESLVQQEYYCSWTSSSEETLIPLDIVEPCFSTILRPEDYNFAPRIIGADPAYAAKGDMAVIAKRQGRLLHPLKKYRGLKNPEFAAEIAQEINSWYPHAVFIDAGRGEGVIHRLWQLGYEDLVIPVHFGGRPLSDLYNNKRSEMYCKTRDWFLSPNRPFIPRDEDLVADLSTPTFIINDRGFVEVQRKAKVKEVLMRSTDCGDAVALTHAEDVFDDDESKKQDMRKELGLPPEYELPFEKAEEYDPLNYFNKEVR